MKILEIIPQLTSGGAERFVVDLCNTLSKSDTNNVTLLLLHPLKGNDFYLNELSDKIRYISLNKPKGFDIRTYRKLYKFIKIESYDIVHTHLRAIIYIAPLVRLLPRNIKFFHTVHNDAIVEAGNYIGKLIRKYAFSKNRVIPITISHISAKSFNDYYNLPNHIIYNGRNLEKLLPIPNIIKEEINNYKKTAYSLVFLNIARMDSSKQQLMLAKSVQYLVHKGYDIVLLIIGNNTDLNILKKIQELNSKNIYILGERKNPLDYLRIADCFCLSSKYEGLPITILEALGTGCIPISTPVGGVVDIINDGENGFISEDTTFNAYVKAIMRFLSLSIDKRNKIRLNALSSFKSYSIEICAQNYLNLFKSYIDNRNDTK